MNADDPTSTEARLFVAGAAGLCLSWGFAQSLVWPVLLLFPCALAVVLPPARAMARGTGVPLHRVLGFVLPFSEGYGEAVGARFAAYWLPLRPRWWRAVVRASGWPRPLVGPGVAVVVVSAWPAAIAPVTASTQVIATAVVRQAPAYQPRIAFDFLVWPHAIAGWPKVSMRTVQIWLCGVHRLPEIRTSRQLQYGGPQ